MIDFEVLHCNETAVAESVMGLLSRGAFLKLHVSLMGKVLKYFFPSIPEELLHLRSGLAAQHL